MASRFSKIISNIDRTIAELDRRRTIPLIYRDILEERLSITFEPFTRLERSAVRRRDKESRVHFTRKKAREVYLNVLDESPQIYLPFILVLAPPACGSFNTSSFQEQFNQQNQQRKTIRLGGDAKELLKEISERKKFDQNPLYKKLIQLLFPTDSVPRPISAAESDVQFTYHAADTNAIRIFGDRIYDFVESAPARIQEKANLMLQTTECVRVSFAQYDLKDGVFCLDIGCAGEIASILFPHVVLPLTEEHPDGHTKDNAYFTLKGASISAIASLFSPKICGAIDASDLRAWEKERYLLETTDCVMMKMSREEPHWGTLIVRIGYISGFPILSELCA